MVGTHALLEDDVVFDRLAVAVVDEQHRFGVRQRAALDRKGMGCPPTQLAPHVLHMTATPIPRTLALTEYGDLDVTRLRELPRGRRAIATHVAANAAERARAYERIREELRAGRQAYVVCPLVEESQELEARAATAEYERLRAGELREFRLELLHGQLRPREKREAMARFAAGAVDVLVATTVIEVGIDVPNATVMLVENAERYGISQLHQLRGRIGRGEHPSVCLLLGPRNARRLRALAEHGDGFELAEIDLRAARRGRARGHPPARPRRAPRGRPAAGRGAAGTRARVGRAAARRRSRAGGPGARAAGRGARVCTGGGGTRAVAGMRVIAGKYGGRRLRAPRGRTTRPTSDRVREALFSMLGGPMSAGSQEAVGLQGTVVLDLFAGTGALAIEALSRGAERAVLIERDPRALEALKANLAELGLGAEEAEVRRADALAALRNARERAETYDLVFVDPPYRHAGVLGRELREALPPLLAPRARVVTESDRRTEPPLRSPLMEVEAQRRYGDTVITIQRRR